MQFARPAGKRAGLLTLLPALALAATACGAGGTASASDVQACLEEEGFEVEHKTEDPEEIGRTDELTYERRALGDYKIGTAVFYESAEDAERSFQLRGAGGSIVDQVVGIKDTVVYTLGTSDEDDPDFAKVEGCI